MERAGWCRRCSPTATAKCWCPRAKARAHERPDARVRARVVRWRSLLAVSRSAASALDAAARRSCATTQDARKADVSRRSVDATRSADACRRNRAARSRSRGPGKFRWTYDKPYEQLIVGDGEKLWIYDPDLNQVTCESSTRRSARTPAALLAGDDDVEKAFELTRRPAAATAWIGSTRCRSDEDSRLRAASRLGFDRAALARDGTARQLRPDHAADPLRATFERNPQARRRTTVPLHAAARAPMSSSELIFSRVAQSGDAAGRAPAPDRPRRGRRPAAPARPGQAAARSPSSRASRIR